MKEHLHVSIFLSLLIPAFCSIAQETPDPKQANLAITAHLNNMAQADLRELIAKARAGDVEEQYLLGLLYEEGRLVPKDVQEARAAAAR